MRNFLKFLFYLCLTVSALGALLKPFKEYLDLVPWGWVLAIIGGLLLVPISFFVYRFVMVRLQNRRIKKTRFERISPLYNALETSRGINEDDVHPFASDLSTRWVTLELLLAYGLTELFPPELYTIEHTAIGNLASWLEFPTELDAIPDEIEHVERVTIDYDTEGNKVYYHVFKFRVDEPHWAADKGWMLGVVGPYFDDSEPYFFPGATFSRLNKFGEISPKDEAQWVHENISLR